ncbi:MAG: DUF72 domain-containing protein [Xylophilus ampelinus]
MQDSLFPDLPLPPDVPRPVHSPSDVVPWTVEAETASAAARLPPTLRLGTSSWNYPGWAGIVWDGEYAENALSRFGLTAYALHPLMRAVSLDRAFYRAMTVAQFQAHAAQVPDDFRFVVKAPNLVTDAKSRDKSGHRVLPNPDFLSAEAAVRDFALPALDGLGHKLGALVFQLSPLPADLLADRAGLMRRLGDMLAALPDLRTAAPDAAVAVEVRDPVWLSEDWMPDFSAVLRDAGATFCLGLHARMPAIDGQLAMLRRLWPGPLVCRWNLHRMHGGPGGFEEAERLYAPFAAMRDPDPETRQVLAKVILATTRAGYNAYVTVSNKAEGSAPRTVVALAEEIRRQAGTA